MPASDICPSRYPQIRHENFRPVVFPPAPPSSNSGRDDCALNFPAQLPSRRPSVRRGPSCRSGYACNAGGSRSNKARGWLLQLAFFASNDLTSSVVSKAEGDNVRSARTSLSIETLVTVASSLIVVCGCMRQTIEYTVPRWSGVARTLSSAAFDLAVSIQSKAVEKSHGYQAD